jgi:transposase
MYGIVVQKRKIAMHVQPHTLSDIVVLKTKAHEEKNAKQRDRYRAVILALDGRHTQEIMRMLGRSKNFVQRWTYFYRDGGIEALRPKPQSGRPTKLPRDKEAQFKARMLAGPSRSDNGVCTLRAKDAQVILEQEFGVRYSFFGVYDLLHRLGFSCLKPRPRHTKNDPAAMEQWLQDAPFLSTASNRISRTKRLKSGSRTKPE